MVKTSHIPKASKTGEVISRPLHTITSETSVEDAAKKLINLGIKKLIVVDGVKPAEIVSTTDLAKHSYSLIDLQEEFVRARHVPPDVKGH